MNKRDQFIMGLRAGDEVYWTDPVDVVEGVQENSSSGFYRVVEIFDPEGRDEETIVVLNNAAGSELEAYMGELS
jgi:hypothetical protein